MSKKPKVFENQIDKTIRNNKMVFDSTKEETKIEMIDDKTKDLRDEDYSHTSVIDKIRELLNRNGYIFNVLVTITTRDKEFKTHIASVVNNHIITLDNNIINIDDVVDIKY